MYTFWLQNFFPLCLCFSVFYNIFKLSSLFFSFYNLYFPSFHLSITVSVTAYSHLSYPSTLFNISFLFFPQIFI